MKAKHLVFVTASVAILAAGSVRAGVSVGSGQEKERLVAFRVSENKYVTANAGGALDLSGLKIGTKQTFALIDLNGGELEDGDKVKIRYTPNSEGKPDPSKTSYWAEVKEGIRRIHDSDVYSIKRVGPKYAFQTSNGKFVAGPVAGGALGLTDKQEDALLVELVDLSSGIPKASRQSKKEPAAPAAEKPAPETPAPEKPATPVPEKPATE